MVVYIHIFPNGKRYVGLTMRDVKDRWKNGKGYQTQKLVYNAILKYGWDNISHIVYECDTESEMKYLERYLISFYNTTDHRYGYNITTGGESANGNVSKYRKPIDQYSKDGQFIKTWESLWVIGQKLNYDTAHIGECIHKHRPTAYNFYWFYSGEKPVFKTRGTRRKVYQFNLNGEFIAEFKNASEAGRSLGKSDWSHITQCCNKKCKSAYNYIWSYENDNFTQTI